VCAGRCVVADLAAGRAASDLERDGAPIAVLVHDGRVSDDGVGGADPARGSGLRGIADRVAALGGTMTLDSPTGLGTRLVAELPCG
jgi:glucose-6-phosphate-specific signal transduction histidine kinase